MSEHEDTEDAEYGLVMPFVVCRSEDGPYEDQAFVAGYQAGQIDVALKVAVRQGLDPDMNLTVFTDLLPQLDLIAMRHGYQMTSEQSRTEGWTYVHFRTAT